MSSDKIKVVISKVGLDGHDRGARAVAAILKEAGMEVIYLGMLQTPESIVQSAIQEDADVIGISCLCGQHLAYTGEIARLIRERGIDDVLLLVGGVIPVEHIDLLKNMGASEVFRAGTSVERINGYIRERVRTVT